MCRWSCLRTRATNGRSATGWRRTLGTSTPPVGGRGGPKVQPELRTALPDQGIAAHVKNSDDVDRIVHLTKYQDVGEAT